MARKGGNKKRCERYRLSGHKEENKMKRQARHQKRMERFAKRKEEGKAYKYEPIPYEKGSKEYNKEVLVRAAKNTNHKTPCQKVRSAMDILKKSLEKQKKEEKAAMSKATSKKA